MHVKHLAQSIIERMWCQLALNNLTTIAIPSLTHLPKRTTKINNFQQKWQGEIRESRDKELLAVQYKLKSSAEKYGVQIGSGASLT